MNAKLAKRLRTEMAPGRYAGRRITRIDDAELQIEWACEKERNAALARRIGLPAIGSKMLNKHGIEWEVLGHTYVPTVNNLRRFREEGEEPEDLYPVVKPNNISERFLEFYSAVNRASPRNFMFLDTMPEFRTGRQAPDHHSFSSFLHPGSNIAMIDAARIHETILAHEIGHAWVEYVELCEDERVLKMVGDPARSNQLSYVQSFVLDLKVNEVIRRKGFDMSIIDEDQLQGIRNLGKWLSTGHKPGTKREEVFMALVLAAQMLEDDRESRPVLARVEDSISAIRQSAEPIFELATGFADAVRRNGYSEKAGIVASVGCCIELAFTHTGDPIDIDAELVIPEEEEITIDKDPEWLAGLTVNQKCEIGRKMALEGVPIKHEWGVCKALGGLSVTCRLPDGRVLGPWHFSFPFPMTTEERRLREIDVNRMTGLGLPYIPGPAGEALRLAEQNKRRFEALISNAQNSNSGPVMQSPYDPMNVQAINEMNRQKRERFMNPANPVSSPAHGLPNLHGRPYMAGLGRFLTQARLDMVFAGEHPYGYALDNPTTYVDPLGLAPIRIFASGFINRGISNEWNMDAPWFPELPTSRSYFDTTSSNRFQYQSIGDSRDKLYARVSFDPCDLSAPKECFIDTGVSHRRTHHTKQVFSPKKAPLQAGSTCSFTPHGSCVNVHIHAADSYPYISTAPPVILDVSINVCQSGPIVTFSGNVNATAFPDFDFRFNVNGNWNNWFYQPTRYSHPSIGLFNEQNFRLPMTSAQTTPCNL